MKRFCQFLLTGLLCCSLCSVSCKRTAGDGAATKTEAVLTGFDQRACPCCGGLMITFNGETKPYVQLFFLVDNDPASLGIDASATFPVRVSVSFAKLDKCGGAYVRIQKLERR